MPATSAEFLEPNVPFARAVLQRGSIRAVMTFGGAGLFLKIDIEDGFAIERNFDRSAVAGDLVFVPLKRLINLLSRCDRFVETAGQFSGGRLRLAVIPWIHHLEFHSIKSRIAKKRRAQSGAAVAAFAKFPFEFENEIAVFLFAHEPSAARFAAVEHAIFDSPGCALLSRFADIIPAPYQPAFGDPVFRE